MSPETLALASFALQLLNVLIIPAVWGVAKFTWRMDRRLYAIEVKLGMHSRASDHG